MTIRTLAASALLLGLSACGTAEFSGVALDSVCIAPAPDTTTLACAYSATCDATMVSRPVLDAATAQLPFRLAIQLDNSLPDNSSTAGINTNGARIQSFEITYSGGPYVAPWSTNVNIRIPVAGTTVYEVPLIPVQYFSTLKPSSPAAVLDLLVNVRAHGVLDSQTSFTTAWFPVPVDVCNGCLSAPYCTTGTLVSCPSAPTGAVSPGQTATWTCATLPQ